MVHKLWCFSFSISRGKDSKFQFEHDFHPRPGIPSAGKLMAGPWISWSCWNFPALPRRTSVFRKYAIPEDFFVGVVAEIGRLILLRYFSEINDNVQVWGNEIWRYTRMVGMIRRWPHGMRHQLEHRMANGYPPVDWLVMGVCMWGCETLEPLKANHTIILATMVHKLWCFSFSISRGKDAKFSLSMISTPAMSLPAEGIPGRGWKSCSS